MIVACLIAAGTAAIWLFHRDWQEKTLAASMMSAAIAFAWLQYGSTFRGDPGGATLVCELNGLLAVILLFLLGFGITHSLGNLLHNPRAIPWSLFALLGTAVAIFATNAWLHWKWRGHLIPSKAMGGSSENPRSVSLREVFLLILAIGLMLGITSYGVQVGWHNGDLF